MCNYGWKGKVLSRTIDYSLLLLKSSKSTQQRILAGLDNEDREKLLTHLKSIPDVNLTKLRFIKRKLLNIHCNIDKDIRLVNSESVKDDYSSMVEFIIESPVFNLSNEKEAANYLNSIDSAPKELIASYVGKNSND